MSMRDQAWQLLCRSLAPDGGDGDPHTPVHGDIWRDVVLLADYQLVSPTLWVSLTDKGWTDSLPRDVHQYLSSVYAMNERRNRALLAQLDEAATALNATGIVPVLLKGASYLKVGTYSDPGARILTDLDLLIDPAELSGAVDTLRAIGYRESPDSSPEYYTQHHHCAPLSRPGDFGSIEVHKRVLADPAGEIFPVEAVWDELVDVEDDGIRVRCLSPSHATVVCFLHSQVVDRLAARFLVGLRAIQDTRALHQKYGTAIDWRRIYLLMQRGGQGRRFREYVHSLEQNAGIEVMPGLRVGIPERLHHAISNAAMRSSRLGVLTRWAARIDTFSAFQIQQTFRCGPGRLTVNRHRLRHAADILSRRIGPSGA